MKRYSLTLTVIAAVGSLATSTRADETRRNAWGIYAAPTTHHVSSGTDWEQMESSTDLDFGIFYSRHFAQKYSFRIEAKWVSRDFEAHVTTIVLPSGGFYTVPTAENFVEIPAIFLAMRSVSLGDATLRISVGGGAYYAVLASQEFARQPPPFPDAPEPLDAGGYSRYGVLGDGGVALLFDRRSAVFLNLRIQDDLGVTGEPENAVAPEDMAFGFYGGFEWLF